MADYNADYGLSNEAVERAVTVLRKAGVARNDVLVWQGRAAGDVRGTRRRASL
jgi:hypothetical protein